MFLLSLSRGSSCHLQGAPPPPPPLLLTSYFRTLSPLAPSGKDLLKTCVVTWAQAENQNNLPISRSFTYRTCKVPFVPGGRNAQGLGMRMWTFMGAGARVCFTQRTPEGGGGRCCWADVKEWRPWGRHLQQKSELKACSGCVPGTVQQPQRGPCSSAGWRGGQLWDMKSQRPWQGPGVFNLSQWEPGGF